MVVILLETIHVVDIALEMAVFPHLFPLLFGDFAIIVGALPVQHSQILISNVVPTEVTIFSIKIRRLHGG